MNIIITKTQLDLYCGALITRVAVTTREKVISQLNGHLVNITGEPSKLWESIDGILAPYTRVTLWTRVTSFWEFLFPDEVNPYKTFRTNNANLFKHAYAPKRLEINWEAAKDRINLLDAKYRDKCIELLRTGMRYSESFTRNNKSEIVGKGGKVRRVYDSASSNYSGSYCAFYLALKKVGLTPHMLRKLAATRAAEKGATLADLMHIFGWTSINTAAIYLQPKEDERLKQLMGV